MILEMNEGAKRANDKMHQCNVERQLDAIKKEVWLLGDALKRLLDAMESKETEQQEPEYHGEGTA